ncbi:hypothetical protein ABNF65_21925, partial [Paenibacillus larvae]
GYEYGSFHFLEPSFLHNYTDSTANAGVSPAVNPKANVRVVATATNFFLVIIVLILLVFIGWTYIFL